ncbi:helix-turn-helix domain-containing protein [Desulfovibrio fairfieldensis]|uniref:DNA-binding protein n=1 Tax=Desulfovibrio fairfieldensis TaxID=44742 RepID=A0A0X8JJJ0_9BACT|nr:helix-turn-helix domain-containing protein [Desulfovibrio fairfieldensis]AMD89876.1 DNA-binding protein [Desulfovibrio fairfieldensis]
MIYAENPSPFIEQLKRIHQITGTHSQTGLAAYLSVRRSAVTNAKRTGMIPAEWLLTLLRVANVNPEWILSGAGPCRFRRQTEDVYEDGETAWERQKDYEALQRLSSRALADELVRRIAVAEAERFLSPSA